MESLNIAGDQNRGRKMVYFHAKNIDWAILSRAMECKRLVYIFYCHLEYSTTFLYILCPFGMYVTPATWRPVEFILTVFLKTQRRQGFNEV
jgi:hypothetical protein